MKDIMQRKYGAFCFAAVFGFVILVVVWLRATPDGITRFIVAGNQFVAVNQLPVHIHVMNGPGYDGQFYFRLALDPFNFSKTAYGVTLDNQEWRSQRILYPLLCHLLSFGQPTFVPFAMVAINALGFVGIILLIGRLTHRLSSVLMTAMLGGLWMSLARDCSEVTAVFFMLLCWYLYLNKNVRFSILCGILAVFAKETAIVGVLSVCVWEIVTSAQKRHINWISIAGYLIPEILWGIWKLSLHMSFDAAGIGGSSDFSWPFAGIVHSILLTIHSGKIVPGLMWMAYFVWILWFVCAVLSDRYAERLLAASIETSPLFFFAFFTLMIWITGFLFFSNAIWGDIWGFMRVSVDFQVAGVLLLAYRSKLRLFFEGYSLLVGLNTVLLISLWP
jgi:hypothetical protein